MLLPPEQRQTLLDVLSARFKLLEDFRTFLRDNAGRTLDAIYVGDLTNSISRVVENAEATEWLVELVDALYEESGAAAREKLRSIRMVQDIRENRVFDDCYVNPYPLVNRKDLRARLRTFTGATGPRILNVKGARYSGKSHALLHIRHVAQSLGIPLAEIELRKWATGEEIRPSDIGQTIAHAVTLTPPSSLDAKPSRWTVNFLDWLAPQLGAARKRLWIVFDDFESEKLQYPLPDSLYDFIQLLAEKVAATPAMRLFLINYEKPLPAQVRPSIAVENVPSITEQDLGAFFFDFFANHVPDAELSAAEQEAIARAKRVAAKMAADPALRLETMRDALIDECTELLT